MEDSQDAAVNVQEMFGALLIAAGRPIYVNDYGVISCNADGCFDDGYVFGEHMPGRRHAVSHLLAAIEEHHITHEHKPRVCPVCANDVDACINDALPRSHHG